MKQKALEKALKKKHQKHASSGQKVYGEKTSEFEDAYIHAQSWALKYKSPDEIPDSAIPTEYDFRNIKGYDFTGAVRDQLECGSCYTLGFIQSVEARLKLKYAHKYQEIPSLSPQFTMLCNYINEGCDGGWGIFNGYFSEKGHMVTEECAPYKARTKGDSCSNYSNCPGFARVKSSYYVGGYNFNPDEKLIQKEMLMHGPVVTEFKADDSFQLYKEGILTQNVIPYQPQNDDALMVPI